MPTTSMKYPGTTASVDRDGKASWSNTDNAKTNNSVYTTCDVAKNTYGDWLYVSNFGFSTSDVPELCCVTAVTVTIKWRGESTNLYDNSIQLVDSTGIISLQGQAESEDLTTGTTTVTRGTINPLWNTNVLTSATVRSSSFGVYISIGNTHITAARLAEIDYVGITITYETGVTPWRVFTDTANGNDGYFDWAELTRARTNDNLAATCTVTTDPWGISENLAFKSAGFVAGDFPTNYEIDGIEVQVRKRSDSGYIGDYVVKYRGHDYTLGSTNQSKGQTPDWSTATAGAWSTYGGSTDLWGVSASELATPSNIYDAITGIIFQISDDGTGNFTADVFCARMRFHYSEVTDNISKINNVSLANINKIIDVSESGLSKINSVEF